MDAGRFVNSHQDLSCDSTTRAELRALAERLAHQDPPVTILTCVSRVAHRVGVGAKASFESYYTVTDPVDRTPVFEIPCNKITQETFAEWLLLQVGNTCASCLGFLLDGEEGLCMTCESREVMALLRLRDQLG